METSRRLSFSPASRPHWLMASACRLCWLIAPSVWFLLHAACLAEVTWEQTVIKTESPQPGQPVTATFHFTNAGSSDVEIRKVETSCSCTAAKADLKKYAPGAKGTLRVVFTPGNRRGLQKKTVIVETSERQRTILSFEVELPEAVLMRPKELVWKVGASASAQVVELSAAPGGVLKVEAVQSMSGGFQAVLRSGRPGFYEVEVKPTDTTQARRGSVRLTIVEPVRQTIYLKVSIENG